jgi:hypothetical protein
MSYEDYYAENMKWTGEADVPISRFYLGISLEELRKNRNGLYKHGLRPSPSLEMVMYLMERIALHVHIQPNRLSDLICNLKRT